MAPENTLTISAVASARPSISPTASMLAPRLPTRNSGNRLCTSSEDRSMNRLTKPSAQTVRGMRWGVLGAGMSLSCPLPAWLQVRWKSATRIFTLRLLLPPRRA
ncbi:hypothetical protein D9M71_263880 [compost metagenome]